jgi:hypothetical protein
MVLMADIPRWLELQAEIDYRIFLLNEMRREDGRLTPLDRLIDEATGHDEMRLAEANEIIAEIKVLKAEWDALVTSGGEGGAALSAACTGPDCGEQFHDSETGEYLFATRERMERLLYADGWQADPVLCPACQEEAGS